jgi:YggT family protein
MGSNYMTDPMVFLIDTLFSLYILAVMLRFLLQWTQADFYNSISQFLVTVTHPALRVMRRVIPAMGRIDTSSLVLALILQIVANFAILAIKGVMIGFGGLVLLSLTDILKMVSWFAPGSYGGASSILYSLTEPLLSVCRRIVPDLGGIDLSPLIALVLLQLAKMMILPPLHELASLLS